MCLRDTSLQTGIRPNKMTFAECSIAVTVLRMIVTNSLNIKWLYPNYIEHCVTGCSQGGPKEGFVMGSGTQDVQEILKIQDVLTPPQV